MKTGDFQRLELPVLGLYPLAALFTTYMQLYMCSLKLTMKKIGLTELEYSSMQCIFKSFDEKLVC